MPLKSNDSRFVRLVLNGQLVLLPDVDQWEELKSDPMVDQLPVKLLGEYRLALLNFAKEVGHPVFLGLYNPVIHGQGQWLPLLLLKIGEQWQRVDLAPVRCRVCGRFEALDPFEVTLYAGCPDKASAYKRAGEHPKVACPKCGGELSSHRIWVGRLLE